MLSRAPIAASRFARRTLVTRTQPRMGGDDHGSHPVSDSLAAEDVEMRVMKHAYH